MTSSKSGDGSAIRARGLGRTFDVRRRVGKLRRSRETVTAVEDVTFAV